MFKRLIATYLPPEVSISLPQKSYIWVTGGHTSNIWILMDFYFFEGER